MKTYLKAVFPIKYCEYVEKYSTETELPKELVYAVIRTESGFDEKATSHLNAKGLMQIMPETLDWVRYRLGEKGESNYEDLYNAPKNIYYGCHLIRLLTEDFDEPLEILTAYHAGAGNVKKWLKDERYSSDGENLHSIPFKDTDKYVKKVLRTMEIYKIIYNF